MIEFLNQYIEWWHWIVLGILLIIAETLTGTFLMLGFGISSILVGAIDYFFPIAFTQQLILWSIFSILFLIVWLKFFKDRLKTKSGQSDYRLDTLGTVIEEIKPHSRGKVKFDMPVLGNSIWHATSKVDIPKNCRVKIIQINGELIEVKPIKGEKCNQH